MDDRDSSSATTAAAATTPLFALSLAEAEARVKELGGRAVHVRALRRAALRRGARELGEALEAGVALPAGLLARLRAAGFVASSSRPVASAPAGDGSSKLGLQLADGRTVECVVLPAEKGLHSVCVSSQVGCPVGCPFCASGVGGLVRNLAAHEIVEQFAHARAVADVRRAVVMGIGEPLLNFENVVAALDVVVAEMGLAPTRLVISSVGFPERVRRLAASGRRFGLAVSLHAVNDALRERLVPMMKGVPVRDVVAAARAWAEATRGRVQFEYVVLAGVNDDLAAVDELARLVGGFPSYVNFIPWNRVEGMDFAPPDEARVAALVRRARELGLVATRRRTLGDAAAAACGQLRRGLEGARVAEPARVKNPLSRPRPPS
jgi:23S rRNA (adenine2503-C2)-methyltransferase